MLEPKRTNMNIRKESCKGKDNAGVDLNRNYGFKFGEGHSSKEECMPHKDDYRGPSAFSEPETQAMRDFIT